MRLIASKLANIEEPIGLYRTQSGTSLVPGNRYCQSSMYIYSTLWWVIVFLSTVTLKTCNVMIAKLSETVDRRESFVCQLTYTKLVEEDMK